MFRLFSQMAQDCQYKIGKVIWVAGHSGPETADDSRTHFGIFAPGVTQLFPEGTVINLHPWEYNEVPVMLAAALNQTAPKRGPEDAAGEPLLIRAAWPQADEQAIRRHLADGFG